MVLSGRGEPSSNLGRPGSRCHPAYLGRRCDARLHEVPISRDRPPWHSKGRTGRGAEFPFSWCILREAGVCRRSHTKPFGLVWLLPRNGRQEFCPFSFRIPGFLWGFRQCTPHRVRGSRPRQFFPGGSGNPLGHRACCRGFAAGQRGGKCP